MKGCRQLMVLGLGVILVACSSGGLEATPSFSSGAGLAVGGTTTVRVGLDGVCEELQQAEASDDRVARVTEVDGCEFELEGMSAGRTSVVMEAGGVTDELDVRTADPHSSTVEHTCTEELTASYLTETDADVRYQLFDGADNPLWGDVFYVELSDSFLAQVTDVESGESRSTLQIGDEPGAMALTPRGTDPPITLSLIERSALDGLDIELRVGDGTVGPGESTSSSQQLGLQVTAREGRRRVCNWGRAGFPVTMTSVTPEVCQLGDTYQEATDSQTRTFETGEEAFNLWVLRSGTCEVEAELSGDGMGEVTGALSFDATF